MKPNKLTIRDVEKVAGPTSTWSGNCYAVACAITKAKLVAGTAVYGHWTGHVHPKSMFYTRSKAGFCRHGWVELEDGCVLDPTRWVFEHVEPYIYVGDPSDFEFPPCECCGHLEDEHEHGFFKECSVKGCNCPDFVPGKVWPYDEGANRFREAMCTPPPLPEAPWVELAVEEKTAVRLEALLGRKLTGKLRGRKLQSRIVGVQELFWIANLPYDTFLPNTVDIYRAIVKADRKGFVPIDNLRRAEREGL